MKILEGSRSRARRVLEEIANAFRSDFPSIYAAQLQATREAKAEIGLGTGVSATKTISLSFVLLPEIRMFVQRHLGADFFRKKENRRLFLTVWQDLRIK